MDLPSDLPLGGSGGVMFSRLAGCAKLLGLTGAEIFLYFG
jgi:hypothetical protein